MKIEPCRCPAYAFPHRAGGGVCPDLPAIFAEYSARMRWALAHQDDAFTYREEAE